MNSLVEEAQRLSSGIFPDFSRAVGLLDDALKHRPETTRLHLYRGSALYESGRNEEAIADLERSLQLSPGGSVGAHWLIVKAAQELGDEQKARRHWELASQRDPDSNDSLVVQALAMPYDERSIKLLTQAIERDAFDPLLYYYRGRAGYNLLVRSTSKRFYDAAIDDLDKALSGRPKDQRVRGDPLPLSGAVPLPFRRRKTIAAAGQAVARYVAGGGTRECLGVVHAGELVFGEWSPGGGDRNMPAGKRAGTEAARLSAAHGVGCSQNGTPCRCHQVSVASLEPAPGAGPCGRDRVACGSPCRPGDFSVCTWPRGPGTSRLGRGIPLQPASQMDVSRLVQLDFRLPSFESI